VTRFLACLAVVALSVACQSNAQPLPSPVPSPTPHTLPTAAILQSADVPAGLNPCLGSGPMDVYLAELTTADATVATRVSAQWQKLRAAGAEAGAVSVFAADQSACKAELGATGNVKAVASMVAVFADPGEANRAWGSGVFGFAPPAPGELVSGVTRGTNTGLGLSSFTYDRPPVQLACWHRSVFVALVVVTNLDAAPFKAATVAVDARLN
jgi:hypothetical protein